MRSAPAYRRWASSKVSHARAAGVLGDRSAIAWPAGIFLLTALVAVWAAYDTPAAWARFGSITLGVAAVLALAWLGQRNATMAALAGLYICGALCLGIGIGFLLTHDWEASTSVKFATLQDAGLSIQAHRPAVATLAMNTNTVGALLATLLPPALAGAAIARRRRHWRGLMALSVSAGVGFVAFILTASRGAWIGLAAGGFAALIVSRLHEVRLQSPHRAHAVTVLALGLLAAGALLLAGFFAAAVMLSALPASSLVPVDPSGSVRIDTWRHMLALVGDYPFTGVGLGSVEMAYSSYVLLLHVGFLQHAHNLFLQVAVEQGLPALIALLWLMAAGFVAVWQSLTKATVAPAWCLGVLASLVAFVVHGMFDAQLYAGPLAGMALLPIGLALTAGPRTPLHGGKWVLPALILLSCVTLYALPTSRAALYTNLGAVTQTRAELSGYEFPAWAGRDEIRRSAQVDLMKARSYYEAALALSPANVTANRRLGQLELSSGEYDQARQHLQAAYAAAPRQHATNLLLGETYALAGDAATAVALWATIDTDLSQLEIRRSWYEYIGDQERRDLIDEAIRQLQQARGAPGNR